MVKPPSDAILQSARCGVPGDEFLSLVLGKVRRALGPVPSPSGTWTDEEIEEVTGDFLTEKWPKITLKVWELHTDRELHAWMRKVVANFIHDRGRETPRGRLKRRIERVIGDMADVRLDGRHVHGDTSGSVPAHDRVSLLELLWKVATTTAWWAAEGEEDPTPGDREDLTTLIRCVVEAADGPVELDLLADVLAYRLNLPLGWSVSFLEYEVAETYLEDRNDIPPASREAAARLLAGLNELELYALPVYVENPAVSSAELGRAIGKGKSTGNTVKNSLVAKLEGFAGTDPEAEMALRAIGRDVLAGRFDPSDRSDLEGEEDDEDVP